MGVEIPTPRFCVLDSRGGGGSGGVEIRLSCTSKVFVEKLVSRPFFFLSPYELDTGPIGHPVRPSASVRMAGSIKAPEGNDARLGWMLGVRKGGGGMALGTSWGDSD